MALSAIVAVGAGALALATTLAARRERKRGEGLARAAVGLAAGLAGADPVFVWDRLSGTLLFPSDPQSGIEALDILERDDLARLGELTQALRATGAGFETTLRGTEHGRVYRAHGWREATADLVRLEDQTMKARHEIVSTQAQALARERERFRGILDTLPMPVWLRHPDLTLAYCNAAYARAVGTDAVTALVMGAELAGAAIGDGGRALASRARALRGPQNESHHVVVGTDRRLLEFTESPSPDSGDLVGYAADVTALENVQAQLASHIAAHADVLENLTTPIAIFGPDRRLKFFNFAYRKLARLDEAVLSGEPSIEELFDQLRTRRRLPEVADFAAYKRSFVALFTSLIGRHDDIMYLPDGQIVRVVIAPHPFGGLTFVYEDVTDRLALESSYNTMLAVQRATLDNLYEGVAVFGSDGRLKLSNPVYGRMWRLSPAQLEAEIHISSVVDATRPLYPETEAWPERRATEIARVTNPQPETGRTERSDGSVLDYAVVPLPDGNVLLSYLDVTDSFRVEQALLERNAALETADRLKSQFVANVSYELRTPLNSIIGFAEILGKQYFGPLNARQVEYSDAIRQASLDLMTLINDILDLATIEGGYMILDPTSFDVSSALQSVLTLVRDRARERDLQVELDCAPDAGLLVGDERRIKQALFNLAGNAIKFTPAGGRVTLGVRREGEWVTLYVHDNGIGIAESDRERVFETFERGRTNGTGKTGAGLGLSLVRRLIELHGGHVELQSAPGQGTTVTCYLPAVAAVKPPIALVTDDAPGLRQ